MTAFLLLWLATQAAAVLLVWMFTVGLGRPVQVSATPGVVVIVAVKGHHPEFDRFLEHLFAQDYPSYRVIFAVESADDPAVRPIETWRTKLPDRISLVVAGLAQDEGQKVTNLRAAIRHVKPSDEIVVFADADIRPLSDWLKRLVAPLLRDETDIVSGFAWLVVDDRNFSTFVMASMAATLVTIPRLPFLNSAWGGSTAMRRQTFTALDLDNTWRGSLCDDMHLTIAAQRAGFRISAPREMLPRLFVTTNGFGDVAADGLRWLMLFRIYLPITFVLVLLGFTFAAAGWIVALAGTMAVEPAAIAALVGGFTLAVLRTAGRAAIAFRLWGRAGLAENRAFLLRDPFLAPLAVSLNAAFCWIALFKRRTTWAGITYDVRGPVRVKIVSRQTAM
ncbi:MAG TPA: glycosyltransferase [Xanthobacteraceae bacterium]|nr:glycosyltransferase [Xanthobacteraceae bacterium]